ncbi:MAG: XisH family protein [Cyanobacteria bacterium P01_H01_bin.21]
MPAKDAFHDLIVKALQNEGWTITHDPYRIELEFTDLCVDLGAERILGAAKGNEKIAIEIKSFLAASKISEFHTAIGQFINYKIALEDYEPDRKLYLAVPFSIHSRFFSYPFIQKVVMRNQVPLLIYDDNQPEIRLWKG